MTSTFATRLRAVMRASGMRVMDVAQICETRPETVRKWLKRKDAPKSARNMACIAEATGADLMTLIMGDSKIGRARKYSKRRGLLCLSK